MNIVTELASEQCILTLAGGLNAPCPLKQGGRGGALKETGFKFSVKCMYADGQFYMGGSYMYTSTAKGRDFYSSHPQFC